MMANASRTPIVRAMLVSVDGADVVVDVVDDSDHDENDENDEDHEVGIVTDVGAIDDCVDCVVVVEFAAGVADVNVSVVGASVVSFVGLKNELISNDVAVSNHVY